MKNVMAKRLLMAVGLVVLSAGMLTGCGKSTADEAETVQEEVVTEEAEETEEEGGVTSPFEADMEKYASILSTLTADQYYAFAAVGEGEDILLVTDGVYDNLDGNMATIDAKVYAFADNGEIFEAGSVWSDGTAYPISVTEDGLLMFGGNHHMATATVMDGSVVVTQEAFEEFDEDGNATYSVMVDNEETVLEDNSLLTEMFDKFNNAIVINFNPAVAGEAAEEGGVNSPVGNAMEQYDSIISGLKAGQSYAFADICADYDVLLVTDYTYDNLDGNKAAIDATIYAFDPDGNVIEFGSVQSEGTAYPLAVYDGCLMFGGNHHVGMTLIQNGNMTTKLDATESFDEDGNATYYLFDLDNQFEGEVDDDTKLKEMYDMYSKAVVINFTEVQ